MINISAAVHTLKESKGFGDGVNNLIALGGVGAELTSALYSLKHAHAVRAGDTAKLAGFAKNAAFFEKVGNGVTAFICAWESYKRFDASDTDAAAAWGGASAGFLMATLAGGPLMWAGMGIGLGFVILAYYLTDTPLEEFIKNNALSDERGLPKAEGEKPGRYITRVYDTRGSLNPDSTYHKRNDFLWANVKLSDLLVASDITVDVEQLADETKKAHQAGPATIITHRGLAKTISVTISFRQFLRHENQLACRVHFYQDGLLSPNTIGVELRQLSFAREFIPASSTRPPKVKVTFTLSDNITAAYKQHSQLLFVCGLSLGDNRFYPAKFDGKARFLGAYINTLFIKEGTHTEFQRGLSDKVSYHSQIDQRSGVKESRVAVDTHYNLLSGGAWNKGN